MRILLTFLFCAGLLSIAPSTAAQSVPEEQTKFSTTLIGPGDLLDISVLDTPEFTFKDRVASDGTIAVPISGAVAVAGLTPLQASKAIEARLVESGQLRTAAVTILVEQFTASRVTVLGEVKNSSIVPLFGEMRLLDVISQAGGLQESASGLITVTHRNREEHPEVFRVASHGHPGDGRNPALQSGDTIMAEKAGIVYVVGAVQHPGGFVLDLDRSFTALKAMALAEGPKRTARLRNAIIVRRVNGQQSEIPVDLNALLYHHGADMAMEDDDILYVPLSRTADFVGEGLQLILPAVAYGAVYRY
jgi:polysaccharide export outer membrane protein